MIESQVESPVGPQVEFQNGILSRITVGALLQFQSVATPSYYVIAATPKDRPLVLAGERTWGNPDFVVTMYSYDGASRAKISLQSRTSPIGYWAAGKSFPGYSNPLVIEEHAGDFILTDTGRGVSIQNSFNPPAPYIHVIPPGLATYLGYGYPDPGGNVGLFAISIVG